MRVFSIATGQPIVDDSEAQVGRAFEMQDRLVADLADAAQLLRDNPDNLYLQQMVLASVVARFLPAAADVRTVLAGGHPTPREASRHAFVLSLGEKR